MMNWIRSIIMALRQLLWGLQGATPPNTFQPSDIAGLIAWYKADSISQSDGTGVASLPDSSGNGNTITNTSDPNQPIFKTSIVHGKPVLRFSGAQWLAATGAVVDASQRHTVYMVSRAASLQDGCIWANVSFQGYLIRYKNNSGVSQIRFATPVVDFNDGQSIGTWEYMTALMDFTSSSAGTYTLRQNGSVLGSAGSITGEVPDRVFHLGADGDNNSNLDGDIAEIIIYNGTHDSTQIAQVETYLKNRYGL
jgi:hypothetical protein